VKSLSIFVVAIVMMACFVVVFWSDAFQIKPEKVSIKLLQEDLFDYNEAKHLLDTLESEFSFFV